MVRTYKLSYLHHLQMCTYKRDLTIHTSEINQRLKFVLKQNKKKHFITMNTAAVLSVWMEWCEASIQKYLHTCLKQK